ncbi:MAG: filamentous hemagglutinin N-terminal domain-containing protein [Xenococcaceae cyanobacterium MO_188.B29]|nr:filamentous hemagglutinin N-terminal domain-containing protein [Xenococcaceae cyanobacterium MO_188.B29]
MNSWYSLLSGLVLSSVISFPVKAQITIDGTTNTQLTPIDNGVRIDEGDRAGGNLFHSFDQFSVLNGSEAFFNNANDIVNIFSRVTGGNISDINGLISANGNANLFLINPAGIIFGESASLNIGGSFLASTADSIVFGDNVEFLATDSDNPPLLTINMPIGLNLSNNPGNIVNQSVANNGNGLEVVPGETITLIGGNVDLDGGIIEAPGGRVELGGLSAAGEIDINADGSLSFPDGIARGDITLTDASEVDVRAAGGGSISMNGRNIEISGGELGQSNLFAGIAQDLGSPEAVAGDITLNATDTITVSQGSRISNRVEESGVGNAGEINLTTTNLSLREGGRLSASTFGQGNAGVITINALGTISAEGEDQDGNRSGIVSQVQGEGDSGEIDITTTDLSLRKGGRLNASTFGQGNAGAITINASGTISTEGETQAGNSSGIFSQVIGEGDSGGIDITTTNLSLREGGRVSATTFGQGNAGVITINASGTISAEGETQTGLASGILSQVQGEGDSGEIDITTANLSLREGGRVSASTLGQGNAGAITIKASDTISVEGETQAGNSSGIFTQVIGEGNSGEIDITTTNLSLREGGRIDATTFGQKNAGEITINASDTISAEGKGIDGIPTGIFSTVAESGEGDANNIKINTNNLSLTNDAQISVGSFGKGSAGDLDIQANSIALDSGASLLASTPVGTGGNITLEIAEVLTLRDNSTISAEATNDANGGNIEINSDLVVAFPNQNNDIIANAEEGNGGNINITTRGIFGIEERSSNPPNNTNDIDPSSQLGTDGIITINELEANPAEGIEDIPRFVIDPDKLVVFSLCSLARDSEFYFTAKGGNTPDPVEIRDEGVIAVDLVEPVPFEEEEELLSRGAREQGSSGGSPRRRKTQGNVHQDRGAEEMEKEIVEAQGWIFHENGVVELVAYKTDPNGAPVQPQDPRVCPNTSF